MLAQVDMTNMFDAVFRCDVPDLSLLEYDHCRSIAECLYVDFSVWRRSKEPLVQVEIVESLIREFELALTASGPLAKLRRNLLVRILGKDVAEAIQEAHQLAEDSKYIDCYINFRELGICQSEAKQLSSYSDIAGKAMIDAFGGRIRFCIWLVRCVISSNTRHRLLRNWLTEFLLDDNFSKNAYDTINQLFAAAELPLSLNCWIEATDYLRPRFREVLAAMPIHIREGDGFAKLLKVLGGVIAHGMSAIPPNSSSAVIEGAFMRCIRVGFCWAVTYPLLDDVIDSGDRFPTSEILMIKDAVSGILSGDELSGTRVQSLSHLPHAAKLIELLIELRTLVPYDQNLTAYRLMHLAHLAQNRDSELTLGGQHSEHDVFVTSTLKAALVRIATALIAGAHVDQTFVKRAFLLAPFNQGEDNFQDFLEDLQTGAVTSFTYFSHGLSKSNPVHLFLLYGRFVLEVLGAGEMERKVIDRQTLEVVKNLCTKHTPIVVRCSVLGCFLSGGDNFSSNLRRLLGRVSERTDVIRYIDGETTLTRIISGAVMHYEAYSNSSG